MIGGPLPQSLHRHIEVDRLDHDTLVDQHVVRRNEPLRIAHRTTVPVTCEWAGQR